MKKFAHQKVAGILTAFAIVMLWGCGGQAPQATTPSATPMSEAQREQNALPLSAAAPIPKTLRCKGDIVWVNMHTKAYHEAGDPYYGKTKNGQYMCKAAADAAGYHLAGTQHAHTKHMKSTMVPTPAPEST